MKLLILADSNSSHTIKWVRALKNNNYQIRIFSLYKPDYNLYQDLTNIVISSLDLQENLKFVDGDNISKLIYLKAVLKIKRLIKEFNPDILHAHYASSYGLLGALSGFHPFVLSVWGADIFDFPNISFLHKAIIKYNLSKSDKVLSTSKIMKEEIKKYTKKHIEVTPFGVDTERFFPQKVESIFTENDIVIGTVKSLEKKYGIEYLIKAFDLIRKDNINSSIKLLIVGKGTLEQKLKELAQNLGLTNDIIFTGYINHDIVEKYHNMLDISVSYSTDDSESFGVAVLEASACEKPVVVAKVGGLQEVVEDGITGFVIEPKNIVVLANVLKKLILNPDLRNKMGKSGRERVMKKYDWNDTIKQMITVYNSLIN
jgi:glycosyltransferase involved in cell wall biosynthesis